MSSNDNPDRDTEFKERFINAQMRKYCFLAPCHIEKLKKDIELLENPSAGMIGNIVLNYYLNLEIGKSKKNKNKRPYVTDDELRAIIKNKYTNITDHIEIAFPEIKPQIVVNSIPLYHFQQDMNKLKTKLTILESYSTHAKQFIKTFNIDFLTDNLTKKFVREYVKKRACVNVLGNDEAVNLLEDIYTKEPKEKRYLTKTELAKDIRLNHESIEDQTIEEIISNLSPDKEILKLELYKHDVLNRLEELVSEKEEENDPVDTYAKQLTEQYPFLEDDYALGAAEEILEIEEPDKKIKSMIIIKHYLKDSKRNLITEPEMISIIVDETSANEDNIKTAIKLLEPSYKVGEECRLYQKDELDQLRVLAKEAIHKDEQFYSKASLDALARHTYDAYSESDGPLREFIALWPKTNIRKYSKRVSAEKRKLCLADKVSNKLSSVISENGMMACSPVQLERIYNSIVTKITDADDKGMFPYLLEISDSDNVLEFPRINDPRIEQDSQYRLFDILYCLPEPHLKVMDYFLEKATGIDRQ